MIFGIWTHQRITWILPIGQFRSLSRISGAHRLPSWKWGYREPRMLDSRKKTVVTAMDHLRPQSLLPVNLFSLPWLGFIWLVGLFFLFPSALVNHCRRTFCICRPLSSKPFPASRCLVSSWNPSRWYFPSAGNCLIWRSISWMGHRLKFALNRWLRPCNQISCS